MAVKYSEREALRLAAVRLFEQDVEAVEVAGRLNVSAGSARRWRKRWLELGRDAIYDRPRSGRPSRLSEAQRKELVETLLAGAEAAGFDSDYWSLPRVKAVIAKKFGVDYHVDHLSKLMARLGFSSQKPDRQARKKDPAAVEHFRQEVWKEALKKGGNGCCLATNR